MIHYNENGQPYSPAKAVLAFAVISACQVGAVLAIVERINENNNERMRR